MLNVKANYRIYPQHLYTLPYLSLKLTKSNILPTNAD